jgi:hypothetical protein
MPIAINGSGTVTGISVGGLPDGIVDTDMLAADAITAPKIGTKTFVSYAIIGDQKSSDTAGGTFTTGSWQTRDLNTEISDADGIVSISSNQFTLAAGSYLVKASAPAHRVNNHQIRLQNITDSATTEVGSSEWSHYSYATTTRSFVSARFTISGSKVFEIQHRCSTTYSTIGYGRTSDFGAIELYTLVEIYKES